MGVRNPGELGWGLLLLAAGVVILLANFGMLPWSDLLWGRWWPLILIAIGVLLLVNRRPDEGLPQAPHAEGTTPVSPTVAASVQPRRRAFPTGAIILIGIGIAFLAQDIVGGGSLPALVLIAIGIALLLRERWGR